MSWTTEPWAKKMPPTLKAKLLDNPPPAGMSEDYAIHVAITSGSPTWRQWGFDKVEEQNNDYFEKIDLEDEHTENAATLSTVPAAGIYTDKDPAKAYLNIRPAEPPGEKCVDKLPGGVSTQTGAPEPQNQVWYSSGSYRDKGSQIHIRLADKDKQLITSWCEQNRTTISRMARYLLLAYAHDMIDMEQLEKKFRVSEY